MTNIPHITRFGLPGVDLVPFGMHACHIHKNRDQLVSTLVPYSVEGLRSNERCLWITSPSLPAREAVRALRSAWDGVDDAIRSGALRVRDFDQWYAAPARLDGPNAVQLWLDEEEQALDEGYNGLRIAGNTSFVAPGDWSKFIQYEHAVSKRFYGRKIIALCSYALAQCNERQINEAMRAHHCTLEGPDADGLVLAVPQFFNGSDQVVTL